MILLDTNVLSALMQRVPEPSVVHWLNRQPTESIWTTSITVFEIRFGLELLADGRRRRQLEGAFKAALDEDFAHRVAVFDSAAAVAAGRIAAHQRQQGAPIDFRDVEIAGIALARRATLATRNTRHFSDVGIALVNPWTA